jgi:hypothetical protein
MYSRPYNIDEVKKNYPDKAEKLLKDPVHLWRAKTGIELIHKEPTLEKQKEIWKNWNEMPDEMKKKSDAKSLEFFGKDNVTHNEEIMRRWGKNLKSAAGNENNEKENSTIKV